MSSQDDAICAAVQVAREHGLVVADPFPLRSTNNVVAWLRPSGIVAKVGVGRNARLGLELEVALALSALGAPVVSPATELPAVVHSRGGLDITFWRYHPQPPEVCIEARDTLKALRQLHQALERMSLLRACLPSYMRDLEIARGLLDGPGLPALGTADNELLALTFDRLQGEVEALAPAHVVLHGSPHAYNVLIVEGAPRFIDFETVCTGPVEWDLVHVERDDDEELRSATVCAKLCQTLADLASVTTAIWCWADVERGDLRTHAQYHLDYIRTVAAARADRSGT
jgi:hypothetical protein